VTNRPPFAKSLRSPWQWIGVAIVLVVLAAIDIGPIVDRPRSHQNASVQFVHVIGLAMFSYANDNNGKYPKGNSSTEVFQKLIDGGYVTDPSLFYAAQFKIPGKTKATSNKLKPENVCWDVTTPVDANSNDPDLPVVFSTGYRIEYVQHGNAVPLSKNASSGIFAMRVSMAAWYIADDGKPDGIVPDFIRAPFDSRGVKYIQLTPDGPLP
jgi:hypothetical protein